jgi:phospholipid/cholesterol/gamma-HCH transport system substrate-binding protein
MAPKNTATKLGIFIFIGFILIVTAIFLIGNKESMFSKTLNVKAYFKTIEGLRKGAPVRLSGIDVGSIKDIQIVGNEKGQVEVTMRLNADVQRFIKTNTRASIETEGLVGNKVINLQLMPGEAPQIQNDGSIQGIEPLAFGVIIEEAQGTLGYIKDMSKNLSEIIEKVNEGNGSIGKLINSNELYNNTNSLIITADRSLNSISNKLDTVQIVINSLLGGVQNIVGNIDKVVGDVDKVLININSGKGLLGELVVQKSPLDTTFHQIVANLMSISESTKNGAIKFEENMEALKRNWLFKSYFEQRGYYDKTAYEQQLDTYIKQINERVKLLDERIETMRKLQKGQKQQ